MQMDFSGLDSLSEDEFRKLEISVDKLLAVWHIKTSAANNDNWHDDQRIGEKRRIGGWPRNYLTGAGLAAAPGPPRQGQQQRAANPNALPPIESLEGNMLIHAPTTWVFDFNEDGTMVRVLDWTFGIEGLSQNREVPVAVVSMMRSASTQYRMNGKWQAGGGGVTTRTTKNDHPKDWVHHMRQTSTRPPMTFEADRQALGKYAYRPFEVRNCVPAAPDRDSWKKHPDFADAQWALVYLPGNGKPSA